MVRQADASGKSTTCTTRLGPPNPRPESDANPVWCLLQQDAPPGELVKATHTQPAQRPEASAGCLALTNTLDAASTSKPSAQLPERQALKRWAC